MCRVFTIKFGLHKEQTNYEKAIINYPIHSNCSIKFLFFWTYKKNLHSTFGRCISRLY